MTFLFWTLQLMYVACVCGAKAQGRIQQRLAYVIASYGGSRHSDSTRDHVPPESYLQVHLSHLASILSPKQLSDDASSMTVLIVKPPLSVGHIPLDGFYDLDPQIKLLEEKVYRLASSFLDWHVH
jgi:hypothetical protein